MAEYDTLTKHLMAQFVDEFAVLGLGVSDVEVVEKLNTEFDLGIDQIRICPTFATHREGASH